MANTKSAIKRIRRIATQTMVNKARRSKYKNAIKKMNLLILDKKKSRSIKVLAQIEFRINESSKNWNYQKSKCFEKCI